MHEIVSNLRCVTDYIGRMPGTIETAVIAVLQANDECKVAAIWDWSVNCCDKRGDSVFFRVFSP